MKKQVYDLQNSNTRVKVYFKDETRFPIIGYFVALKDSEEMLEKGMSRFVTEGMKESFDISNNKSTFATKLLSLNTFSQIRKA